MQIGNRKFEEHGKTYVMGILNVTPDSFSDGGNYNGIKKALYHAEEMIAEGVDIIDVGGESTKPDYTQISPGEEISRVLPVIMAIKERYDIPISIDTYKAEVAKEAVDAGADLINDIWGLKYDKGMAEVVKETGVCVCLMHNRGNMEYDNFMTDVMTDLEASILIAKNAGIPHDKIMIDPGIGFAKSVEMNLMCINKLEEFKSLSYPVLLGASRKSVIGRSLNLPINEREEGTIAATVIAVMKGCQFVRVHNVRANKRAIMMTEAILSAKSGE